MTRWFSYYIIHTFINSFKKLFRTWLAVVIGFIALFGIIGGVIGASVAWLTESQTTEPPAMESEYDTGENEADADGNGIAGTDDEDTAAADGDHDEENSLTPEQRERAETLISGILFLIVLIFLLGTVYFGDKSGTSVFEMADVNLLFTAPIKPQTVLAFRLILKTSAAIIASFYLLGQIPNLINSGFSAPGIIAVLLGYILTLILSQLAGVVTYTLVANARMRTKKSLIRLPLSSNRILVIVITALLLVWLLFLNRIQGLGFYETFAASFGHSRMRLIPLVGWITSFVFYANIRAYGLSLLFLLLTVAGMALMVFIVWRIPADFYEDALPGAEKNAAMVLAAQEKRLIASDKKHLLPSSLAGRDKAFSRGSGASVFFFRNLHHRFRAGLMGFFTSDSIAALVIFIGYSVFCLYFIKTRIVFPVFLILLFLSLFKGYFNPLAEEMAGHLILLTPEELWKKFMFAILGDIVSYTIDLLPGIIIMNALMKPDISECILFLILLLTAQLYSECLSLFIRMALPPRLSDMVYAFFYFGLLSMGLLIPFIAVVAAIALKVMFIGISTACAAMLILAVLSFIAGTALAERGIQ